MKTYRLTINAEQADIISRALDFYSRVGGGQVEEIGAVALLQPYNSALDYTAVENSVNTLKRVLFGLSPNAPNCGIGNSRPQFQTAYDLHQVIRNRLAWDRQPEGGIEVWFDSPMKWGPEPLAEIKEEPPNSVKFIEGEEDEKD